MEIRFDLCVNGALVLPTDFQKQKIVDAINEIVFGEVKVKQVQQSTPKRHYKHKRVMTSYTKEEDDLIVSRYFEGAKPSAISKDLQRITGVKRTPGAIYQRNKYLAKKLAKTKPVDDLVLPTNPATNLKPNEWGGTAGLQAHNLA